MTDLGFLLHKPDTTIEMTTRDSVVEKSCRRREISTEFADFLRKVGGGGGSRTRVREYAVAGLYMRSRPCCFATAVKERRKPAVTSPEKSRRRASEARAATSLHL